MKIWILKPNEAKPIQGEKTRLGRMGLLAEELSTRGHDVVWYTSTFSHLKKKQIYKKDTTIEVKPNYILEFIKTTSYKKNISIRRIISYRYMAYQFRKKAKEAEKPDIIYVSFPTIELAREAILYGKKNQVPVVVDIRDLWPDIFNHNLKRNIKNNC